MGEEIINFYSSANRVNPYAGIAGVERPHAKRAVSQIVPQKQEEVIQPQEEAAGPGIRQRVSQLYTDLTAAVAKPREVLGYSIDPGALATSSAKNLHSLATSSAGAIRTWWNKEESTHATSALPSDPLDAVIKKIDVLKLQLPNPLPSEVPDLAPAVQVSPVIPPLRGQSVQERPLPPTGVAEGITDGKLAIFNSKLKNFTMLQILFYCSGIEDLYATDRLKALTLTGQNSYLTPWQLFQSAYASRLGWWGSMKASLVYLILWKGGLLPKTIDAYTSHCITELRNRFKHQGEARHRFFDGALKELDNFLTAYNGAAKRFVQAEGTQSINHYRNNAIAEMERGRHGGKTAEEIHLELCKNFSITLIDRFTPSVRYTNWSLIDDLINRTLHKYLRNNLLPPLFFDSLFKDNPNDIGQYNTPFLIALTKKLIEQVTEIKEKLEKGELQKTSSSFSLQESEITSLSKIVDHVIFASHLKDEDPAPAMKKKIAEAEASSQDEVRKKIHKGITDLFCSLIDNFSKEENSEQLFSLLFDLLNDPLFAPTLLVTQGELDRRIQENTVAKLKLHKEVLELSHSFIEKMVEDTLYIQEGIRRIELLAEQVLEDHKNRMTNLGFTLTAELEQLIESFSQENIHQMERSLSQILQHIYATAHIEKIATNVTHTPQPRLATLPQQHQTSILNAIHPLHQELFTMLSPCEEIKNHLSEQKESARWFHSLYQLYTQLTDWERSIEHLNVDLLTQQIQALPLNDEIKYPLLQIIQGDLAQKRQRYAFLKKQELDYTTMKNRLDSYCTTQQISLLDGIEQYQQYIPETLYPNAYATMHALIEWKARNRGQNAHLPQQIDIEILKQFFSMHSEDIQDAQLPLIEKEIQEHMRNIQMPLQRAIQERRELMFNQNRQLTDVFFKLQVRIASFQEKVAATYCEAHLKPGSCAQDLAIPLGVTSLSLNRAFSWAPGKIHIWTKETILTIANAKIDQIFQATYRLATEPLVINRLIRIGMEQINRQ
ncbi:MAG TPA: hypothetical protein VJK48_00090 [Chlamydiales bacterium]|nr:hypothetical protein [Chlamydiales bacterium]